MVVHTISTAYWAFGSPPDCDAALKITEAFLGAAEFSTSVIFTLRVSALMGGRSKWIYPIYFLNLCVLGGFIAVLPGTHLSQLPVQPAPFTSWCFNPTEPPYVALALGLVVLYDTVIVITTFVLIRRHTRAMTFANHSAVPHYLKVFLRDSFGFFVFSFVVNVTGFIWTIAISDPIFRQQLFPFSTMVCFTMAPRVVINLRSANRQGIHNTSGGQGSGTHSHSLPQHKAPFSNTYGLSDLNGRHDPEDRFQPDGRYGTPGRVRTLQPSNTHISPYSRAAQPPVQFESNPYHVSGDRINVHKMTTSSYE